jgi:hypothetical protein
MKNETHELARATALSRLVFVVANDGAVMKSGRRRGT